MADKQEFPIKRNDLLPSLVVTLLDGTTPVDLTLALSARLIVKNRSGVKVNAEVTIHPDQVTNPGVVTYEWAAGDTDTKGKFDAEIEVMWPGNKPQTFPASGYFVVNVVEQLG